MKSVSSMTAAELQKAIDRADKLHSAVIDEMIEAGRGHERPTETATKTDPLSVKFNKSINHAAALSFERRARQEYHGTMKPIRRASNPLPRVSMAMVGSAVRKNPAAKTPVKKNPARKAPAKKAPARKSNPTHSAQTLKAAKLYKDFSGHDPESLGKIKIPDLPKTAVCVGHCDGILYTTVRDGRTEKYIHKFHSKDKPLLCVSPDGKQTLLVGGNYDFTERGFVDASDPSSRR